MRTSKKFGAALLLAALILIGGRAASIVVAATGLFLLSLPSYPALFRRADSGSSTS